MSNFRSQSDISFTGKKAVIRLDLNVPMEAGHVNDITRIERVVPSLKNLIDQRAITVILAHFGRPKGRVVAEMSLQPIAAALAQSLAHPVRFIATDWEDDTAERAVAAAMPGEVLLMENTRFHPGEECDDTGLAEKFAALGDYYINDAFSAAHRAHASTHAIAKLLPSCAGLSMAQELRALSAALDHPKRPMVAVVGGAKISTKLALLGNLSAKAERLIIGGGMANTFLAAQGLNVGKSLCERDLLGQAQNIFQQAQANKCQIMLPLDVAVAKEFKANAQHRLVPVDDVADDEMILDIGPQTIAAVNAAFDDAATLVWNGPFGAFETPPFDTGTIATARHAAKLSKNGKLQSIAGGGDTVAALNHAGVGDDFSYLSTAGGAFLEWLEGKQLPGVNILQS